MYLQLIVAFLVANAYGSTPSLKPNTEYTYNVNGRTLTGLEEISNQYSGILLKAKLKLTALADGQTVQGQVKHPQVATIHTELPDGWQTELPESQLNYKRLEMSDKPFQLTMKNGLIKNILLEKNTLNWEANMIKSIVSQFQLDVAGQKSIESPLNSLPQGNELGGVFKTMEETVTGKTETIYHIHEYPKYLLQSEPWLEPKTIAGDYDKVFEVIKAKNYSNALERPSYHFGLGEVKENEPTSSKVGSFWTRHSESRAILTGKLSKFTVHNSITLNKISVNPNLNYKGKGSIVSVMNVTLLEVNNLDQEPEGMTNPVNIGNLVFIYTSNNNNKIPLTKLEGRNGGENNEESDEWFNGRDGNLDSDEWSGGKKDDNKFGGHLGSEEGGNDEDLLLRSKIQKRERWLKKSSGRNGSGSEESAESGRKKRSTTDESAESNRGASGLSGLIKKWSGEDLSEHVEQLQQLPRMKDAPICPLLPNLVYSKSLTLKEHQKNILKLSLEIGEELNDPEKIFKQSTMEKFVLLGTLLRLLGDKEMKELDQELLNDSRDSKERLAWLAFRDAVADSGTGPAFLLIEKWIEEGKVKQDEAATLLSDMATATRLPTLEFMKKFFELIKKPKVKHQAELNETAVLAFTNLVHRVYVDKLESHNQFPTHAFGSFNTKEGKEWMKQTVIPYLTQQLKEAITEGNTRKIHLNIAALHNIGHMNILQALEPYLEGDLKASQFQRLLMVAALNRLTTSNSLVARAVLYKIFQNVGELPEIRSLAVALLMKTNPSAELLQNIAATTHMEKQEQVTVAVMSAIETASRLTLPQNEQLRAAAESALPLLKLETYGSDKSYVDIRDFLVSEMDSSVKHEFSQLGSQDSYWPKVVRFQAERNDKGNINHYFSLKTFTSSVEELSAVLNKLITGNKKTNKGKHQQNGDNKWSSLNIAKMMGYRMEEKEQLEGMIFRQLGNSQTFWSYDNQSIQNLPEVVRELEKEYRVGKEVQYVKLRKVQDIVMSVPTEMGLPFVFTYDMPILIRFVGKVQAQANPRMSSNGKLSLPEILTLQTEGSLTVNIKTQGRLSFITPFDHEVYSAGFDKKFQAQKPLSAQLELNMKLGQINLGLDLKPTNGIPLIYYSTWPYTSKWELTGITPLLLRPQTQIIHGDSRRHRHFDMKLGLKQTGIAFRVKGHHLTQSGNIVELIQLAQTQGYMSLWHRLWDRSMLSQSEISISTDVDQSPTNKIVLKLTRKRQYLEEPNQKEKSDLLSFNELESKLTNDDDQRNQELLDHVTSGINNADGGLYDALLEFQGDNNIKYNLGLAAAKSNVDPQVRLLAYWKGIRKQGKQLSLELAGKIKNTNALDLSNSFKDSEDSKFELKMLAGETADEAASITGEVLMKRTEDRKRYLMNEHPLYGVCKKQMQEGNYQLAACQNLTIAANFFDSIETTLTHSKINRKWTDIIEGAFKGLRLFYYTNVDVQEGVPMGNTVDLKVKFAPEEFRTFNLTVAAGDEKTLMYNMSIDDHVLKAVLVPHPVFHLKSRLLGVLKGWINFRPTCAIDQNVAQTFSNRTYPISLTDKWTVAVQYIPQMARFDNEILTVEKQLLQQPENYVVLVRKLSNKWKELLLTFNTPETEGQTNTIKLTPKTSSASFESNIILTVNGEELPTSQKKSQDLLNGGVQMYALPNGEVKVDLRGIFYLIFDGKRVKVTATSGKLRNANWGICGRFSFDMNDDFVTPNNCIVKDSQKFVESYMIDPKGKQHFGKNDDECIVKTLPLYTDVISEIHERRTQGRNNQGGGGTSGKLRSGGTQLRNRYIEQNGEICFTLRPVPTCNHKTLKTKTQAIGVHCVQKTKTANYLKNQIDKGGNPDLSKKSETKKLMLELPTQCN